MSLWLSWPEQRERIRWMGAAKWKERALAPLSWFLSGFFGFSGFPCRGSACLVVLMVSSPGWLSATNPWKSVTDSSSEGFGPAVEILALPTRYYLLLQVLFPPRLSKRTSARARTSLGLESSSKPTACGGLLLASVFEYPPPPRWLVDTHHSGIVQGYGVISVSWITRNVSERGRVLIDYHPRPNATVDKVIMYVCMYDALCPREERWSNVNNVDVYSLFPTQKERTFCCWTMDDE